MSERMRNYQVFLLVPNTAAFSNKRKGKFYFLFICKPIFLNYYNDFQLLFSCSHREKAFVLYSCVRAVFYNYGTDYINHSKVGPSRLNFCLFTQNSM